MTKPNEETVKLTTDEQAAVRPTMERIRSYQQVLNEAFMTLQPVIGLFAKHHQLDPTEYGLSEDGTKLVKVQKQ